MTQAPWDDHITVSDVMALHSEATTRWPHEERESALRDHGCIPKSLGAALQAEGLVGAPTPGLMFAAASLYYLIKNHCWENANKRTAWLTALTILGRLRLSLNVTKEEGEKFCLDCENGTVRGVTEVVLWLAEHLVEFDSEAEALAVAALGDYARKVEI